MQSDNKFLSDLAKLGQSAAGTLHGVKSELEGQVKGRLESTLANMDLVRREEYEVVREMATAAREENKNILARLEKIEKEITILRQDVKNIRTNNSEILRIVGRLEGKLENH